MAEDTAGGPQQSQEDSASANGDYLGYSIYAQTLWARVEAALNKDLAHRETCLRADKTPPPLGEDPLVIGIFGEWGAGKSKLLSLVQKLAEEQRDRQIKEHKLDGYQAITVPVFFQPWKYEHEKHLLVPLLTHILVDLEKTLALARNGEDKATGAALAVVDGTKRVLGTALSKVGDLAQAVGHVMGAADPVVTAPAATIFQMLAHGMGDLLNGKNKRKTAREFAHSDDGRAYYEMHRILSEVTRPAKNPHVTGDQHHDKDFCLNFVIFIDDLDRCLPEKAVETLELIKTVFNLESFAFVLALDEEVVERGIGHRYKDYALVNKKPEMPITGFEYLEKIVHLPFRLPSLTRDQARRFLERYEASEVAASKPDRWWFASRPVVPSATEAGTDETMNRPLGQWRHGSSADLSSLVLNAFAAYVPRKLVRLVELLHQVQEVALRRGKALTIGGIGGSDVRVVVALLMIQLFQPDLYRLVRRKPQAFPLLLAAFANRHLGSRDISDPGISDVDLWLWVAEESAGENDDWIQSADLSKSMDATVRRIAKLHSIDRKSPYPGGVSYHPVGPDEREVRFVDIDVAQTRERRFRAQNVKLPLVVQIVEHRAAQRHAFDPLRLFHALAGALERDWDVKESDEISPATGLKIADYFELMVPREEPEQNSRTTEAGSVSSTWSGQSQSATHLTQPVRYPDRLFADLISDQPEVQANLAANNELEQGKVLEAEAAQHLLMQLQEWRKTQLTGEERARLTRGLRVIAPFLPSDLSREFLVLVDNPLEVPFFVSGKAGAFQKTNQILHEVNQAELWSALGQDHRFDSGRFHLPKSRWRSNSLEQEPVTGFVRVPKGRFTLGAKGQEFENNPINTSAEIKNDFYIARYPTTVDQFAHFVSEQGYGDLKKEKPDWWDSLGWLWRAGKWDSQIADGVNSLVRRRPELYGAPMNWVEQRSHGSHPVMQLSWFEARAYANWLSLKLKADLEGLPDGYSVRLPTEMQWERAARAKDFMNSDERQYPWGGNDAESAHRNANISASGIAWVCPVGLFAPNPLGLHDLSGNVWEWQNNLYNSSGSGQALGLTADVVSLNAHEDFDQCDRPALRGGAWDSTAGVARACIRVKDRPGSWFGYVGFRVVLSLDE